MTSVNHERRNRKQTKSETAPVGLHPTGFVHHSLLYNKMKEEIRPQSVQSVGTFSNLLISQKNSSPSLSGQSSTTSSPTPKKSSFGSCSHIRQYAKDQQSLQAYKLIFESYVAVSGTKPSLKKDTSCTTCKAFNGRIHACLSCVYLSCVENGHLAQHVKKYANSGSNDKFQHHAIHVELIYGHTFCGVCDDYMYEDKFEQIARNKMFTCSTRAHTRRLRLQVQMYNWNSFQTNSEIKRITKCANSNFMKIQGSNDLTLKKRKKETTPRKLTDGKLDPTSVNSAFDFIPKLLGGNRRIIRKQSIIGLRGIINLGNTCFMSTIIQSLVHTPTLRDYFLSEKHIGQCGHAQAGTQIGSTCIVCEIAQIFQQFYSGRTIPYSPDRLLYLVWTQARHLAGYEQQDAHEFLIALLDLMHQHLAPRSSTPTSRALWDPPTTMVDRIFTGRLQSDVVCTSCGNISTTVDPFSDISLDILSHHYEVMDCLKYFTRAEQLGPQCKINCTRCGTYQESSKQLTINLLPIVVCLHFKRFEQSQAGSGRKITSFVAFPEELNMSPFMTSKTTNANNLLTLDEDSNHSEPNDNDSIYGDGSNRKRRKVDKDGKDEIEADGMIEKFRHIYSLYAVVTHSGNLQAGHYTSYIKQTGDWFSCDDHTIRKVHRDEVLQSQAYLLFYHRKYLEYS